MPYTEFTLDRVEADFGLLTVSADLFPAMEGTPVPAWLADSLVRSRRTAALISEKARSEFLVAPILTAVQELAARPLAVFSGQRLDVDVALNLVGECDFILAATEAIPRLKAPLVLILEAKRGDIELALGQCAAQLVAARIFNERSGRASNSIYGCVTTGEIWQFLRLDASSILLDRQKYYNDRLDLILGIFRAAIAQASGS